MPENLSRLYLPKKQIVVATKGETEVQDKKEYMKQWRAANKEKIRNYNKQYMDQNRKSLLEKKREVGKLYYESNKDQILIKDKLYRATDEYKKKRRITVKNYKKKKRLADPGFRIYENLCKRMRRAVGQQKTDKKDKSFYLIGCTSSELKAHIESKFKDGMTWDNYGFSGWHIDHIRPCASFDLTDEDQQKECFHYTNLQPLWWNENMQKGDKWTQPN